ncbi:MAG: SDR family oxidoreductase [Frankiales bacterium]|nr:SDR family oxidoreductase [Frankiales bacterium]
MLAGSRLLLTGVVTQDSIAFATARRAQELGAEVLLTALPRVRELAVEAARALPSPVDVLDADLTAPADVAALEASLRERWGTVDGVLHAVAFAPKEALTSFLDASSAPVEVAFRTSVHTYAVLGRLLRDLAPPSGGSLVGLHFDAARAWPVYEWMGVCKAALVSANQYAARDLGVTGSRANLVAAGPLHTRAALGIPRFEELLRSWREQAPLPWDAQDSAPVADVVCFLLSPASRAITGSVVHADSGHAAIASPLRRDPERA